MNTAYCGPAPAPSTIATDFNLDPWLLTALFALGLLFRRNRAGLAAVAVLAVAFVSPLCALSSALFAARVVHHVLLIAVAAPLLALARPAHRSRALAVSFFGSTVVLWVWHLPAAYDGALSHVALYWAMQLTLLASATAFWRAAFAEGEPPVGRLAGVIAAFAQMGMLGAILTFAPAPLYAAHGAAPLLWGLTPLEDQVLGGLIMWVPAALPYALAAGFIARRSWAGLRSTAA